MKEKPVRRLDVSLDFGGQLRPVGTLVWAQRKTYFEYDTSFVKEPLPISPLRLPVKSERFQIDVPGFHGLPGVFADSLPDGWGRLLLDKQLRRSGIAIDTLTGLDRLAHVGNRGPGALVYEPNWGSAPPAKRLDLSRIAAETTRVLEGKASELLEQLSQWTSSSGGARPKITAFLDDKNTAYSTPGPGREPFLIKFPATTDPTDIGPIEYLYMRTAASVGIAVPEIRLLDTQDGHPGYFAIRRFDREVDGGRLHMHSLSGLLHSNFRDFAISYEHLLKVTNVLAPTECEEQVQRMLFNILTHNRDDHSKNHSFLMDKDGEWKLSPAYDLTFSSGPAGEHAMTVGGQGEKPRLADAVQAASLVDVSKKKVQALASEIEESLSTWKKEGKNLGLSQESLRLITTSVREQQRRFSSLGSA